jgi:hypothetical protein
MPRERSVNDVPRHHSPRPPWSSRTERSRYRAFSISVFRWSAARRACRGGSSRRFGSPPSPSAPDRRTRPSGSTAKSATCSGSSVRRILETNLSSPDSPWPIRCPVRTPCCGPDAGPRPTPPGSLQPRPNADGTHHARLILMNPLPSRLEGCTQHRNPTRRGVESCGTPAGPGGGCRGSSRSLK